MPIEIVNRARWSPREWHSVSAATEQNHVWRQISEGLEVEGEDGPRRTRGEPITLRRIITDYGNEISEACGILGVPEQLVAGMIGAESKGLPTAERREGHLNDASIGLTQTLTNTAFGLAAQAPPELAIKAITKLKPLPRGGDLAEWQSILRQPRYAIRLGALYFSIANDQHDLRFDPVLCYAAYNAGSPRVNLKNPWGVHYYRKQLPDGRWADAMDSFSRWYGDACAVYAIC